MEMNDQAEILKRCSQRRPHVVLAWDDAAKKIVAPPTQVAMSWNHAFSSLVRSSSGLIDNFDVPKELFQLPDLHEVLTMEAWESCLSESEKELLSIYLPQGVDQDTAVRALLSGENLHFGNPLHRWGASVCSGAMHPDNLVKRENALRKSCKAQKKYLRNYHSRMIRGLQRMKEIWSECGSNGEVLPRIHRWLKSSKRGISPTHDGCNPPSRSSEGDERKARDGRCEEKTDHKTAKKKSTETNNSHSAKRLKTSSKEDGFIDKEVPQPDFENDFFKKYVEVSVGTLSRDQLSDITLPVKVTKRQFENLKSRRAAGEEVDFDSLEAEEDRGNTLKGHKKKSAVGIKETKELELYWREQVVKSVPGAHTRFLERKTRLLELADSIARSCMEERAYIMRQDEEPCSPERVTSNAEEGGVPTDVVSSATEDESLSENWRGKHLLAGTATEEPEEEFNTQSPQKEAMDLDSAGEEEDVNSPDEKQGRLSEITLRSEEKKPGNECSPVSRAEVDGRSEEVEIGFTAERTWKDVQTGEPFEPHASVMPSTRLDDHVEQTGYGDNLTGFESEQPSVCRSVLSSDHRTFSGESVEGNFGLPEKQELQLLPHARHSEVHNLHHLGSVAQSIQEPAQLFADHSQMSHQFESPITSLINFSKRQHQLSTPPAPLPQHPYPSYNLGSSAPLPMAVPVVELAPMWPGTVHRPSPASALPQFGGGQNGSWPVSDGTSPGVGWGLSEAIQSSSRRAQLQVPVPAPAAPPPRWDVPDHTVYPTDQTVRKPERMFDQQHFYTDWSSRGEFPVTPHSESATPYRAPSWYPTGPFENVGNPLSGNQMQQHLPLQRHPLWPAESAPPKPVPQLWGNMNWRPT